MTLKEARGKGKLAENPFRVASASGAFMLQTGSRNDMPPPSLSSSCFILGVH